MEFIYIQNPMDLEKKNVLINRTFLCLSDVIIFPRPHERGGPEGSKGQVHGAVPSSSPSHIL